MKTLVGTPDHGDSIERYLASLRRRLFAPQSTVERFIDEARAHLREAQEHYEYEGMDPRTASALAVVNFGDAALVAREFRRGERLLSGATVRGLILALGRLGAIGLMAVGVSGVISEVFLHAFGSRFLAGDLPGVAYTASRCADFLGYFPHAGSCEGAATMHHAGEVVQYRIAAGVLGVVAWFVVRHLSRRWMREGAVRLPSVAMPAATTVAFLVGFVGVLVSGAQNISAGSSAGAGQWITGGVVCAAAAAISAIALGREISMQRVQLV